MSRVTIVWTIAGVLAAALAAAGGGHPPGIVLVPFIFAAWFIGCVATELLTVLWRPRRSLRRSFVLIATAANLFVAAPATTLLIRESTADRRSSSEQPWLMLFGPICLCATGVALYEIARSRRLIPMIVLCGVSVPMLWLAVRDGDLLFLLTAIGVAVFQGTAAVFLAINRVHSHAPSSSATVGPHAG